MLYVIKMVFAERGSRTWVAGAYLAIFISAALGSVTPLVTGWAIDQAVAGKYAALGWLGAFNLLWGGVYHLRLWIDNVAIDGFVRDAGVAYTKSVERRADLEDAEVLTNLQSLRDIAAAPLRHGLPRAIEVGTYAAVGLVAIATMSPLLGALASIFAIVSGVLTAVVMGRIDKLSYELLQNRDKLAAPGKVRSVYQTEEILDKEYDVTVQMSTLDAKAVSANILGSDMLKVAAIAIIAASGGTAGEIVAAMAYIRSIDGMADATLCLAQQSAKATNVVRRLM